MESIQRDIHYLPYEALINLRYLEEAIYADTDSNYYWSDDYSAEYYIAQAKAGFIAVTEVYKGYNAPKKLDHLNQLSYSK